MATSSGDIHNLTGNVAVVNNADAVAETVTVTWTTKEGAAVDIVGTLAADKMTLSDDQGGLPISGSTIIGGTRTVTVNAKPTISTFTF